LLSKCTEGTAWVDGTYTGYQAEAKAKNLPFGGYVYWRFVIDAVKQAEHFVDSLGTVQFPPIVDVERVNNTKAGSKIHPIVSQSANVNHLRIVLNEIERLTGVKPMIYTNYASWYYLFGNHPMILDYELWVANWRSYGEPLLPKPATTWKVHQFTASYKVDGYTPGLDANWFNGNEAKFAAQLEVWDKLWNPGGPDPSENVVTVEFVKDGTSEIQLLNPGDSLQIKVN
jgi:GH25 family lysozyme M1 (1,4-beta-N-acetylmuramidase)